MTDILHSPHPELPSSSSSINCAAPTNNDVVMHQQTFLNPETVSGHSSPVSQCRSNSTSRLLHQGVEGEEAEEDELSVLTVLLTVFRKSLVGCRNTSDRVEEQLMEIGWPTDVEHVAHVTFDRFNGFLGLPVEFEPEVPRRPPSASTRVFGVSTESMQLSLDSRGNCVPTILLMMQHRLYSQGGLQSEGIFRINPDNGQEEYVREQLNNGVVPENIDVHCLAGLIKAWFRELPTGVLDSLPPEHVMEAQSEDECVQILRLLPPVEAALLDWAINLMADVAQLEHFNKMSARNIAMVFAPNMTQMSDPLTALMYAVQVMNFLKTLVVKTLREREDRLVEDGPALQLDPSDENGHHSISNPTNCKANEVNENDEKANKGREPPSHHTSTDTSHESRTGNDTHGFLSSIENILPDRKGDDAPADNSPGGTPNPLARTRQPRSRRTRTGPSSGLNDVKGGPIRHAQRPRSPVARVHEAAEKKKESNIISRVNSHQERVQVWR